jgi:hypothetical protein
MDNKSDFCPNVIGHLMARWTIIMLAVLFSRIMGNDALLFDAASATWVGLKKTMSHCHRRCIMINIVIRCQFDEQVEHIYIVMMPHVDVYRSINMACTNIPHLSMIPRSESMKHSELKHLINSELPSCIVLRKPGYILKRRVQCGPDAFEPSSITWSRRINTWLGQIHPHRYHLFMRVQRMEMEAIGGLHWRRKSRWKTYMLWRRWIKMLYPSLSQRMGWSDTLIFAAIDHRISTETVQYIKRKLKIVDDWPGWSWHKITIGTR